MKRKKKPKKEEDTGQNLIMGNMTDAQLAQIAKMNAPRKLGAITVGAKKPPSALRVKPAELPGEPQHIESTATMMGMQSLKTNDNTADQMNPSMAHLQREIDEDSILRDVIGKNKQSTTILSSNKKSLINEQDQRSPKVNNHDYGDALLGSNDFDVSCSQSPGKLDR